jgi:hypothetical protein
MRCFVLRMAHIILLQPDIHTDPAARSPFEGVTSCWANLNTSEESEQHAFSVPLI